MTDLVERVARAIYAAKYPDVDWDSANTNARTKKTRLREAAAVISEIMRSNRSIAMALCFCPHCGRAIHEFKSLDTILKSVAERHGLTPQTIQSEDRHVAVSQARLCFYYEAASTTALSYSAIGRFIGSRDHSTVMKGIERYCRKKELEVPRQPWGKRRGSDTKRSSKMQVSASA